LYEKALEITRRLLTNDHPDTAQSYNNLAVNLAAQGKYAAAQPLFEKALEIRRRLLTDDHPQTATSYTNLATNLNAQGKYAVAQPIFEKALVISRRLLTDDHPLTASSYDNLAANLYAQGKFVEARDQWLRAVKSLDAARLRVAFTGLERGEAVHSMRPDLAAVLARLGQPAEAWQSLEEDLGRGLLDELAARQDRRMTSGERARLQQQVAALEQLDLLFEMPLKNVDQAEQRKQLDDLRQQHDRAQIALGELRSQLVAKYGPLAGNVAPLAEVQAALPTDAALVAWVDIKAAGLKAADPSGEHWGVVVRSQGTPIWTRLQGTGPAKEWTEADTRLAAQVRDSIAHHPEAAATDVQTLIERLRDQRIAPLAAALKATAQDLPAAHRLIILPSPALTGIPVEVLLRPTDPWTISYAPSATVLTYLRNQPPIATKVGLLALGDPVFRLQDQSSQSKPLPDHGLLVNAVLPGSNAATGGLKPGDVLLAYNRTALHKRDDLKAVSKPGHPVAVEVWRDGQVLRRDLSPGKLGVVFHAQPAPEAIAGQRQIQQVLVAARSGEEHLPPLPGTRQEVEALARLFQALDRPARTLLGADASEPELDRTAAAGELARYGFIHLATHGLIDEAVPVRSAVILSQTGLPDPLDQVLKHQPVYDGRLAVREIQRSWDLKAELVTLSACQTARGQYVDGEGFVGFTQALLMSGARSVCLSLWNVDDTATALLMERFYQNLLGRREGLSQPMPKALALDEAKHWLRGLSRAEVQRASAALPAVRRVVEEDEGPKLPQIRQASQRPFEHPYYWAAFVLVGDPD
jgi:CHAT domain-containing protein